MVIIHNKLILSGKDDNHIYLLYESNMACSYPLYDLYSGEGKMPKAFLTEAGIKRSADRRLSMSSVDYEEGPSTSTKTTKKR